MKKPIFKLTLIMLLFSCFLIYSGCATIFSGSRDEINLSSEPGGAKVVVNGQERGKTPLKLSLKKGKDYQVEFTKDGYEKKMVTLTCSLGAGWLILDILAGLVGILVDAITENWYSLDYDSYKAILELVK